MTEGGGGPLEPPPAAAATGDPIASVVEEWGRRTRAEYVSAAIAHEVTLWMIQIGAPPDLIRDGLRVVSDELTHSELSAEVAHAAGAAGAPVAIDAAVLSRFSASGSPAQLATSVVRYFCIGETVAVPLFRMLRSNCSVPVARRALDRVLRDEAAHRQFGWDVLDWLLMAGGETVRLEVQPHVAPAVASVARAYGAGPETPEPDLLQPEALAWGLASVAAYAHTVRRAVEHDVLPRFAERDLGAAGV